MGALLLVLVRLATALACSGAPPPGSSTSPTTAAYEFERRLCVDITNQYRSAIDLPRLEPSPQLEQYAARAAAHDARLHRPHAFFQRGGRERVALAENLVPWWPLSHFHTVREVVERGLEMMWAEGPKGVHYRNLAGRYREVGCGIFVASGEVTVVQAFR